MPQNIARERKRSQTDKFAKQRKHFRENPITQWTYEQVSAALGRFRENGMRGPGFYDCCNTGREALIRSHKGAWYVGRSFDYLHEMKPYKTRRGAINSFLRIVQEALDYNSTIKCTG